MGRIIWCMPVAIAIGLVFTTTGCRRHTVVTPTLPKAPSAAAPASASANDDRRIAERAMNLEDVLLLLRQGESQESIIGHVHERRITQKIVESAELELSLMGARH